MLNLDLTQFNPVQSDSQFANVPLPSAHRVVIEESEVKDSTDQATGFNKGRNLVLHLTILASSYGAENVGEKLALYIPIEGKEEAVRAGMKRLSTLAYTLGLGNYIQDSQQLHGQDFIVVLDKQKENNFANFKRILNREGLEIAGVDGSFKATTLKENALIVELEKLLAGNTQQQNQQQAQNPQQQFSNNANTQNVQNTQQQAFGGQTQPQNQQQFVPQNNFAPQNNPNPAFGGAEQQAQGQQQFGQPAFGQQGNGTPQWGTAVNNSNGQ